MHPAPSVILFSVLSGIGFGLLFFLGLGMPVVSGWTAFFMFLIAFALAVGGLVSSTFHLGNPKNAIKAFSQWRSSWLSREGCLAVASLVLMGLYAFGAVFFGARLTLLGWVGGVLSLGTVFTTSMIYFQLKTVPRWHQPSTPVLFLSYALSGGALLSGHVAFAAVMILFTGMLQWIDWAWGDRALAESGTSVETATGLGAIGSVRAFEAPHTGNNYLLKEMVYVIGRKHAQKLRLIALLLFAVLPVLILVILPRGHIAGLLAFASHLAGVLTSRWLFFAQAEHVVGLYYGKR